MSTEAFGLDEEQGYSKLIASLLVFYLLQALNLWYTAEMSSNLFETAAIKRASDLHVVSGQPAMLRIDGLLKPLGEKLSAKKVTELIQSFLSEPQEKRFLSEKDLDCSFVLSSGVRFRINCHIVCGEPAFAARIIPSKIPSLQEIDMPEIDRKSVV